MNQTKETNDKPAQHAPAPAAALATRAHDAPLATMPTHDVTQLAGGAVLDRVRLEPKTFQEAMLCAELAAKMRLGKVEGPADAMVRIMRGATLGLDAITSCEQIFVVGDRTGMYARLMHAVVLRSPLCGQLEIDEEASTDKIGIVHARRRDESKATTFRFTIEEAEKLVGKKKIDDPESNYSKDRKGMLIAKALTRAAQRKFPEVLMGFTTIEELRDVVEVDQHTGEVKVGPSALPGAPARDFDKELEDLAKICAEAKNDDDFKSARSMIENWTAPEAFKRRAVGAYNEAKKAAKEAQKGEAKS